MSHLYQTADPFLYEILKGNAKKNRDNPTIAESILWEFLRKGQMGVVFKRQHIIGEYIVDFCCLTEKLIIEVDGGYHQRPDQMKDDKQREQWLRQQGFEVVRFDNDQVYNNIEEVLETIAKTIQSKQE